jgi:hypothetical protein
MTPEIPIRPSMLVLLAAIGCSAAAPDVAVEPAAPTTGDDLVVVPPPSPDEVFAWTWRRNGVVVGDLRGDRVPAARTARGERWEVDVVRVVGQRRSDVGTAGVDIGNAPPAVSVSLLPDPPVSAAPLIAVVHAVDPDGETLSLTYAWQVDGEPVDVMGATVPSEQVQGDQRWTVAVTASDGEASVSATAEAVTGNTAPRVASARVVPLAPTENDVLSIDFVPFDPDGDEVTIEVQWVVGGLLVATSPTLAGAFFRRDDVVSALVTPSDGVTAGQTVPTGEVVVVNAPPAASGVAIEPTVLAEGVVASCALSEAVDLDGDPVSVSVRWFTDGTQVSTAPTLSGASFDRGERVSCEATPFDGALAGTPLMSAEVVVANTAPTVGSVTLVPSPPTAAAEVSASVLVMDVDPGDVPLWQVDWYVDGALVTTAPTLDGLVRGEVVQARVQAWDGDLVSLEVSSPAIAVANALPAVVRSAMIPAQPTASDEVLADVVFFDADGDPVTGTVTWLADGAQVYLGPALPPGTVSAGARLQYEVIPDDGMDPGPAATSPEVVVGL